MKKFGALLGFFFLLLVAGSAVALGPNWNNHAPPFDFLFGNHIDTHQQSKLVGNKQLRGYLYITYTGEEVDGFPAAHHGDCEMMPEGCEVGWVLKGVPARARLLAKPEGDHPQWCLDPQALPREAGYSHFHWLGDPAHPGELVVGEKYDGYLLKLTAVDSFFFEHQGGFFITPGVDLESHYNIETDC